jgi:hypothetical protein
MNSNFIFGIFLIFIMVIILRKIIQSNHSNSTVINMNPIQEYIPQEQPIIETPPVIDVEMEKIPEPIKNMIAYDSENNGTFTKQVYNSLDEVILPSSTSPYISRDFICFREKITDQIFMQDKGGCIACRVDNSPEWKNNVKNGTHTNIISTCVYSTDENPKNPSTWNKQKCINFCSTNKN